MKVAVCLKNPVIIQGLVRRAVAVQICSLPSQFVSAVAEEHWTDQIKIFQTYKNIDKSKFVYIGEVPEDKRELMAGVRVVASVTELLGEVEEPKVPVEEEPEVTVEEIEEVLSVIWLPETGTPDYGDQSDADLFEFAEDIVSAPVDIAFEEDDEVEALIGNEARNEEMAVEAQDSTHLVPDTVDFDDSGIVVITPSQELPVPEHEPSVVVDEEIEPEQVTEEIIGYEPEQVTEEIIGYEPEPVAVAIVESKPEPVAAEIVEYESEPSIAEIVESKSEPEESILIEEELDLDSIEISTEPTIIEDTEDYSVPAGDAAFDKSGQSLVVTPSIISFDLSDELLLMDESEEGEQAPPAPVVHEQRKKPPTEVSQVISRFREENRSITVSDTFVPVAPAGLIESRPVSIANKFVVNKSRRHGGRCFVFGGAGGRSDSYLVAYNYACECSRIGVNKVILLDLDIPSATLSRRIYDEAGLSFEDSCGIENVLKISAGEYIGNLPVFTTQVVSQCGDTFSFIRGNATYPHQIKRLLMQANFGLLIENLKHVFDVVIVDLGSLKDLQKYKTDLLRAGHIVVVTYGCGTKRSVIDGQLICERLPCNCELILTDYRISVNPIEVSKITHRRVCGTLPAIGGNARSLPVFSEISSGGLSSEWEKVADTLNRI